MGSLTFFFSVWLRQGSEVDESLLQGLEGLGGQAPIPEPVVVDVGAPTPAKPPTTESNGQWQDGQDSGQWDWKPPASTTTETTFVETSNVKEPLSGDYKVVCCEFELIVVVRMGSQPSCAMVAEQQ